MDRILPIDLERAQLRKSFRGYARKEVEALLKGASSTLQNLLVENDRLRIELEQAKAEVDRARTQENTLKDTLLLAQKAADDTRAAAQRQAENALEEARQAILAEKMAVQQQINEMTWEVEKIKADRQRFADEFRMMIERYQRDLETSPKLMVVEGDATATGG